MPQRGRKTLLVVTHALHLLSRFDRILFLGASGRITADGTFDALVQADGDFARLVHDQQAGAGRARADEVDDADSDPQQAKALMLDDYATTGTVQLSSASPSLSAADRRSLRRLDPHRSRATAASSSCSASSERLALKSSVAIRSCVLSSAAR